MSWCEIPIITGVSNVIKANPWGILRSERENPAFAFDGVVASYVPPALTQCYGSCLFIMIPPTMHDAMRLLLHVHTMYYRK